MLTFRIIVALLAFGILCSVIYWPVLEQKDKPYWPETPTLTNPSMGVTDYPDDFFKVTNYSHSEMVIVPEKFINKDHQLDTYKLVKSYLELEKKFHAKCQGK